MSFQVRYWEFGGHKNLKTEVFDRLLHAEIRIDELREQGYRHPTGFCYILDQTASGSDMIINRLNGQTFRR